MFQKLPDPYCLYKNSTQDPTFMPSYYNWKCLQTLSKALQETRQSVKKAATLTQCDCYLKRISFPSVLTSLLSLGTCGLELYSSEVLSCLIVTIQFSSQLAVIILFLNKLNKWCSHVQYYIIGLGHSISFSPTQENRLRFGRERAEMTGMKLNLSWYFK